MGGESEKIWEFWAKAEKNKGNLSYCILLFLLTATNIAIFYFCNTQIWKIFIIKQP